MASKRRPKAGAPTKRGADVAIAAMLPSGVVQTGARSFEYRPGYSAEDAAMLERAGRIDVARRRIQALRASEPPTDLADGAGELATTLELVAWCLRQPIGNDEIREDFEAFARATLSGARRHDSTAVFANAFIDRVEAVAAWRTGQDAEACVGRLRATLMPLDLERASVLSETWYGALLGLFRVETKVERLQLTNELLGKAFGLKREPSSVASQERARTASRKRNRR